MRVDFYILQGEANRELMACKLCEKAYQQGVSVYVLTTSPAHAQQLNELMWTFKDGSFIPHQLANTESINIDNSMVSLIGWQADEQSTCDMLINLTDTVPENYKNYQRIAEIVNQNESIKQAGRLRFSHYRQQDCELHHHEI